MTRFWLYLILLLAFLLRVVAINKFPPGFTPDEASFGYDAYSILETGKDQWGHTLPLVLESFGDFKPPLYAYLSIPSVAVFGLSKFAIRLPNALIGTAAAYVTYLLVSKLLKYIATKKTSYRSLFTDHHSPALIAALFLAISPWHIMLSRGAFEANLTTFFLPLGMILFLKGLKNPRFIIFSALIFGFNLFSYHSSRLITPIIVLFLILIFKKEILKVKREYVVSSVLTFVIFILLVVYTFTQGGSRRIDDVSIFKGALEAQSQERLEAIESGSNATYARLIHNKYLVVADRFFDNYKKYFSIKFLFEEGAGETTYGMIPGTGVIYWFELVFLICFLVFLFKNKKSKILWFLLFWIVVGPIPAALTTGVGYAANRAAVMMPGINIASGFGFVVVYEYFKNKFSKGVFRLFSLVILLMFISFFFSFIKDYFSSNNVLAKGMLQGNLEVAHWLKENTNSEHKILVSTHLSEPHIYIAFANKWNPKDFQQQSKDWQSYRENNLQFLDQLEKYKLGNYSFQKISYPFVEGEGYSYIVGRPTEFPTDVNYSKAFYYPDGEIAIMVVDLTKNTYAKNN